MPPLTSYKELLSNCIPTKILHKHSFYIRCCNSQLYVTIMKYLRQVTIEDKSFILQVQTHCACILSSLVRAIPDPSLMMVASLSKTAVPLGSCSIRDPGTWHKTWLLKSPPLPVLPSWGQSLLTQRTFGETSGQATPRRCVGNINLDWSPVAKLSHCMRI